MRPLPRLLEDYLTTVTKSMLLLLTFALNSGSVILNLQCSVEANDLLRDAIYYLLQSYIFLKIDVLMIIDVKIYMQSRHWAYGKWQMHI